MSEIQQPSIIIPGHWIGHFIGRGGCFATNIRRIYHVSYNIETTYNDQGHRIGKIYIQGRNFADAKAALCAEASRLNEIDERANSQRWPRPHSPVSSGETPQRVLSGSMQSFPPLPTKAGSKNDSPAAQPSKTQVNPHEDMTHNMQSIDRLQASVSATGVVFKQLREANLVLELRKTLAEAQHKITHLVAKNTLICALLHKDREMASTTLIIRGIPKVRMTGESFGADALRETLAKAGEITSLHLSDAIGFGDKQVCYVTFAARRTAVELQKMLNGNKIEGSLMRVSFFVTRWDNTPSDAHILSSQTTQAVTC